MPYDPNYDSTKDKKLLADTIAHRKELQASFNDASLNAGGRGGLSNDQKRYWVGVSSGYANMMKEADRNIDFYNQRIKESSTPPPTASLPPEKADIGKKTDIYFNAERERLQGQLDEAKRNSQRGTWGGTDAQLAEWRNKATNLQGQLDTLNTNYSGIADKIKSGDLTSGDLNTIKAHLGGDPIATEKLQEKTDTETQIEKQNKQLEEFRGQYETQMFGGKGLSLSEALGGKGDVGQLNRFLGSQEAQTFNTQLKPVIQMALGAQGLSDSGAQVELQSKALAALEQSREQSMMQAALGGRAQLQGLTRQDLLGGIGLAQQGMQNQWDLSRAGITMQFQQQLENQRESLARDLYSRSGNMASPGMGGGGWGALAGALAGGLGGFAFGGGTPMAAMYGAGLGSQFGATMGNMASPGTGFGMAQGLSSSFFNAGEMMSGGQPKQKAPTPQEQSMIGAFGPLASGYRSSYGY